jgi:hypothetical protein
MLLEASAKGSVSKEAIRKVSFARPAVLPREGTDFRAALATGEEASACHNRVHVGGSIFSLGRSLVA